eukprot:jgi/Tetstr1/456552/TSEL_043274.t1
MKKTPSFPISAPPYIERICCATFKYRAGYTDENYCHAKETVIAAFREYTPSPLPPTPLRSSFWVVPASRVALPGREIRNQLVSGDVPRRGAERGDARTSLTIHVFRNPRSGTQASIWEAAGSMSMAGAGNGLTLDDIKAQVEARHAQRAEQANEKPLFGTHAYISVHASAASPQPSGPDGAEGEVSLEQDQPSNSTSRRRRSRRRSSPSTSLIDPQKCNRNIKDLVRAFKVRVARDTFVTRSMSSSLSTKERFSQNDARTLLPPNPGAIQDKYKFDRCAVVGNSGHLRLSRYGANINTFDIVMRTNQAPIKGYAKYVGTKTTFRLINRSITKTYRRAMVSYQRRNRSTPSGRRLLQELTAEALEKGRIGRTLQQGGISYPLEPNVTMILITEAKSRASDAVQFARAIKPVRPDVKILVSSGKLRRASEELLVNWTRRQKFCIGRDTGKNNQNRGTTGLLAVTTMVKLCKEVVVYGFGQPRNGTSAAGYHYYSGLKARTWRSKSSSVHNFPGEGSVIRNLVNQGVIDMCHEESPKICGLSNSKVNELAKKHRTKVKIVDGRPWLPDHIHLDDAEEDDDYEGLDVTDEELEDQEKEEEEEEKEAQSEGYQPADGDGTDEDA